MGDSRARFHSKHLLSTNNVVGTTIDYRDMEMDKDMNLALMTAFESYLFYLQ